MIKVFVGFLPMDLTAKDISILTVKRQKLLISLLEEERTLSRLKKDSGLVLASIWEALDVFKKLGIVERDLNKVYRLTRKGKLMALTLLKPNRYSKSSLFLFDKLLKEELGHEDEKYRGEIIESCNLLETMLNDD